MNKKRILLWLIGLLSLLPISGVAQAADNVTVYVPWKTEHVASKVEIECVLQDMLCADKETQRQTVAARASDTISGTAIIEFGPRFSAIAAGVKCRMLENGKPSSVPIVSRELPGKVLLCNARAAGKNSKLKGKACKKDDQCAKDEVCYKGKCWDGLTSTKCENDYDCTSVGHSVCDPDKGRCLDKLFIGEMMDKSFHEYSVNREKISGMACKTDKDCMKANYQCADGKFCAPVDKRGKPGEYCHHDNHCASGNCVCPNGKSLGFCKDYEKGNNKGSCDGPNKGPKYEKSPDLGKGCKDLKDCRGEAYCSNSVCTSPYSEKPCKTDNDCVNGQLCDIGLYNMCYDKKLMADYLASALTDMAYSGRDSQQNGFTKNNQGEACQSDKDCKGLFVRCADGRFCAKEDGLAFENDYCHHDNHCASKKCMCPKGKSWGFCKDYEKGNNKGKCL